MGFKNKSGPAAVKGTIFHASFELRALASVAEKAGLPKCKHDVFGTVEVEWAKNYELHLEDVFEHYQAIESHLDFKRQKISITTIKNWCKRYFELYPQYDPYNLNLVGIEQFFDFPINEEWAKYDVTIQGERFVDTLKIKGTIDSVIDLGNNIYEIYDLKTGKRECFVTGESKTLSYLESDHQLLFYFYACKKLWPDKDFLLSLNFVNNGGVFTVPGTDELLVKAEEMIKEKFQSIMNTTDPYIFDINHDSWKCKYCCEFSKPTDKTDGLSLCQFMGQQIKEKGLAQTVETFADLSSVKSYQDGGGKKDVENEKNYTD